MKQQIINFIKKTGHTISVNSPHVCAGLAVGGVITTIVLVAKAQIKADKVIAEEREDRANEHIAKDDPDAEFPDVSKKKAVALTWKYYIPAALSAASTICLIIASDSINTRRVAAVSAICTASQEALKEYKAATKEALPEREVNKVEDKLAENQLVAHPVNEDCVIRTGQGDTLCYDNLSGRYFYSSAERIKQAVNEFNHRLLIDMSMSLNEWYDYLDLDAIGVGDYLGFNCHELLNVDFNSKLSSTGKPCLVVLYDTEPKLAFHDW